MSTRFSLRTVDLLCAFAGLILFSPLFVIVPIVCFFDSGQAFFLQTRVGKNKKPFTMWKFCTMAVATEWLPTHQIDQSSITPTSKFLRRTKLDELPQLINVLRGEMSLVGPRPCLFIQTELIGARDALGVFDVLPGITGLAQINGIDMSDPERLAEWDKKMIKKQTIAGYFECLFRTFMGSDAGDRARY